MNIIEVRSAVKSYDHKHFILNELDLSVRSGSIYCLIGASGCGKTTLLSCILGMKPLEKGTVKVFGEEVSFEKPSKFSHLIGYMPQETALVGELTVKETLYFFGNIFQMDASLLFRRFKMICDLLELKDENKLVNELSGGEKRRVSLAAAIIHDPRILILDEPTVGLDSILRDKIWNFLKESASKSHLTVIITTHYFAEAENSTCCGFMRNGVLLIEDTTQNILSKCGVENLDEAFLSLCISQKNYKNIVTNHDHLEDFEPLLKQESIKVKSSTIAKNETLRFDKRKKFSTQTISTLILKEWKRMRRHPIDLFYVFVLPIIEILSFAFAFGDLTGLKFGIVNNEASEKFCLEYLKSAELILNTSSCFNLSCYLLNEIEDSTLVKIYYDSAEQAHKEAKVGLISGYLEISQNFTSLLNDTMTEDSIPLVQIHLDQSDLTKTMFLRRRFLKAYENFKTNVLNKCDLNDISKSLPLNVEQGMFYGSLNDGFIKAIMPGILVQLIIFCGTLFSTISVVQCRNDGIWNRILLAGVQTYEILFVYIVLFIMIDLIQIIVINIGIFFLLNISIVGSILIIQFFFITLSFVGSLIGLFLSVHINHLKEISMVTILILFANAFLSGTIWPLESQSVYLQIFSLFVPATTPAISIRNIIYKGFGFAHPSVYIGFIVTCSWIIVLFTFSAIKILNEKYTQNDK